MNGDQEGLQNFRSVCIVVVLSVCIVAVVCAGPSVCLLVRLYSCGAVRLLLVVTIHVLQQMHLIGQISPHWSRFLW
jgi:hypothetical protein